MRSTTRYLLAIVFYTLFSSVFSQETDSLIIRRIYTEALSNPVAYRNLGYLCTHFSGRLCGSGQATHAVNWCRELLDGMGLDTVYFQPVMVTHWSRGEKETGKVVSSSAGKHNLHVCAIGGSIATPRAGITADVIEVKNFDQLKTLGSEKIKGKIVFFNRAADPAHFYTFDAYGGAVDQRARGAMQAARFGAVAVLVRSATLAHDTLPHTGIQHYADTVPEIPAMSVSTNDADSLSVWLKADPGLKFSMQMSCQLLPEVATYNVIGEIRGSEKPEQVIAFGGHIDAWDIGQGAHDDGAGVVQTIEILRIFKSLNLKPRHTLRVVVFMDEEYDQRGAHAYAAEAIKRTTAGLEKHLAAIEADRGGFTPYGFSIDGTDEQVAAFCKWQPLLAQYGIWFMKKGGSGVDIRDLKPLGIPLLAMVTDSQRYFDYQHAASDTFDKVNPRELSLGAAVMAAMIWLTDTK